MTHEVINIIYAILALLGALIMTLRSKTDHKIITFLITFWILGESVVSLDMFIINIPALGGDLQLKRIVILSLTAYTVLLSLLKFRISKKSDKMPYEKFLFAFTIWFLIVIVYHLFDGMLKGKQFVGLLQGILSLFIPYLFLKKYADEDMMRIFFKAFLMIGIMTSLVAIIQFFIDSQFMRVGNTYIAFAGHLRSQGIYWSEYQHSYMLAFAIALVLVTIQSKRLKIFLISLFLIGIILSFHRMSWIATFLVLIIYLVMEKRAKILKLILASGILLFTLYVLSTEVIPIIDEFKQSQVYQSRLSSNTITNRLKFYEMVINNINKIYLWGAGSTSNSLYYYGMLNTGVVDEEWAKGEAGGIHNLYFEILFFYGIPLLVLFCLMLVSMLKVYFRLFRSRHKIFLFSFLFLGIYCLMNLTNSFSIYSDFTFILGIMLGCTAAVHRKQLYSGEIIIKDLS